MNIDNTKYSLTEKNYIKEETNKDFIIMGNTFNEGLNHFIGWGLRYSGKYKKTAHYTITKDGNIYEHFDCKYHSTYFGDDELDKRSIIVLLENVGYLTTNSGGDKYYTYCGNIYNSNKIVEKKWRGKTYWDCYTDLQLNSAIYLCDMLCKKYNIDRTTPDSNVEMDINEEYGIIYKSNINKLFTDLNPTWNFSLFKNNIENEKTISK